jgi:hypothetical protein
VTDFHHDGPWNTSGMTSMGASAGTSQRPGFTVGCLKVCVG